MTDNVSLTGWSAETEQRKRLLTLHVAIADVMMRGRWALNCSFDQLSTKGSGVYSDVREFWKRHEARIHTDVKYKQALEQNPESKEVFYQT
jgi:hypothetical protein